MKQVISTTGAPSAIGPYSQGIDTGSLIFTSGQLPLNPENGNLETSIEEATRQSLENVKAVLEQAGATLEQVVKCTFFLKDLNDFAAMNSVYAEFFTEICTARSCFQVAKLPMDALVEIEAIAVK